MHNCMDENLDEPARKSRRTNSPTKFLQDDTFLTPANYGQSFLSWVWKEAKRTNELSRILDLFLQTDACFVYSIDMTEKKFVLDRGGCGLVRRNHGEPYFCAFVWEPEGQLVLFSLKGFAPDTVDAAFALIEDSIPEIYSRFEEVRIEWPMSWNEKSNASRLLSCFCDACVFLKHWLCLRGKQGSTFLSTVHMLSARPDD